VADHAAKCNGSPAASEIIGPEMPTTPEEHQRRGDTAEALFREMKRRIAAKTQQGGA